METFLYVVFFLSCIVLVLAVLLQPGKTDAGALFTSGVSSASMNPRGTASVLSKLTIATATIFMLSALLLSLPALTGNRSVLETEGGNTIGAPTSNTNSANSNTANTSNSNAGSSNTSESKKEEEKTDEKTSEAKDGDNKSEDKKAEEKGSETKEKPEEKGQTDEKKEEKK